MRAILRSPRLAPFGPLLCYGGVQHFTPPLSALSLLRGGVPRVVGSGRRRGRLWCRADLLGLTEMEDTYIKVPKVMGESEG